MAVVASQKTCDKNWLFNDGGVLYIRLTISYQDLMSCGIFGGPN